MFNKTFINYTDNTELAIAQRQAARKISETITDNVEKYVTSQNRVNISLQEYENLKQQIRDLSISNSCYKEFFRMVNIEPDIPLIPNTATWQISDDILHNKMRYRIEFDVNRDKMINKYY